jgi:lysophospholipase L1-like esterase
MNLKHVVTRFPVFVLAICLATLVSAGQTLKPDEDASSGNPAIPTIFIVGDSTAAYHTDVTAVGMSGVQGWGVFFQSFVNPAKFNVVNAARGGRSSRTYLTEGLWATLMHQIRPGDIVLIQLGHNDVFPINDDSRARGTLPGIGPESQEIDNLVTHRHETVHTYGWYLQRYVQDTRASGATPIVLSLTTRNVWQDGKIEMGVSEYRKWAREIAEKEHVAFVDVTAIMAEELARFGQAKTSGLYHSTETVHATVPGAYFAAESVLAGLESVSALPIKDGLSPLGKLVAPAKPVAK